MKRKIGNLDFVAVLVILVIAAMLTLPALKRVGDSNARASCARNLKQIGLSLKMYSNESRGERFPSVSPVRDNWIMDIHALYPEYLPDLSALIDPASPFATDFTFRSRRTGALDPDCVSGLFYSYSGYLLKGEPQALAMFFAYESMDLDSFRGTDLVLDVPVWEPRFDDSGLAVLWDRVPLVDSEFSHREPAGGNVLMLDGHVEFVEYSPYNNPRFFPFTRIGAEIFSGALPKMPGHCF